MSKVKIQGHASGTGVLTVTAPNTDTDRTITLPDGTGTLLTTDGDGSSLTSLPATTSITTTNSSDTVFDHALKVNNSGGLNDSFVSLGFHNRADVNTTGIKGALVFDGNGQSDGIGDFVFCNSTAANIATAVTPSDETFRITSDGRGLSQFTAKAWCNFNGTGTVAIRDSHNVSSLTDNTTGDYQVNYTNAMSNTTYSVTAIVHDSSVGVNRNAALGELPTTGSHRIITGAPSTNVRTDYQLVCSQVFGD